MPTLFLAQQGSLRAQLCIEHSVTVLSRGHCYFSPWNLPENNPWLKVSSETRRDAKRMAFSPSSLSLLGGAQAAARSPPSELARCTGIGMVPAARFPRSAHGELHNAPTPSPDLHSPVVWSSCLGLCCSARSAPGAGRSKDDPLETRYDLPPEHARTYLLASGGIPHILNPFVSR